MGNRNVRRHVLALLVAAAVSGGALVGACGATDEPASKETSEPAAAPTPEAQAAAPAETTTADAGAAAADEGGAAADAAPAGDAAPAADAGAKMSPIDRVTSSEKGTLKNPFTDKPEAIAEGHKLYMGLSCNGCHGGGGGGGMCPPLTNETWVYGGDDDTLFRLIVLGSQDLQKEGYARKGQEGVVGPMPPYRDLIDDEEKLWKIIAWLRSVWGGRPEKRVW